MVHNTILPSNIIPQKGDFPQGWETSLLGYCVDILDNQRIPVNSEERKQRVGNIPYYGATGQVGWIDDYLFDEELLLLGEDGAPFLDKTNPISYIIRGKSWVNNHAHVLRAVKEITSNSFLKYYLDYFNFNGYVTGTTRLKLNQGSMRKIPLVLPPVIEQQRIVAKLEKLMDKVDQCKARLEKIPSILKRFRQSVLNAAVTGILTEKWREELQSAKWQETTLGTESVYVTSGSRGWAKYYSDKGVMFIRAQNINTDKLVLEDVAFVRLPQKIEGTRTRINQNDILVTITGANVTKTALVEEELEEAYVNQHVALVRLKNKNHSRYIHLYLIAPYAGRKQLEDSAYGAGKPGLNLHNIRDVKIELPPLEEQQEIVRRVESLFKIADQIEERYNRARDYVEKLTQSILAKAFRGELVPQDPKDEPASVLLERIRAERAKAESNKKMQKKSTKPLKPVTKASQIKKVNV